MPTAFRFASGDLEAMPQFEGDRSEISDGGFACSIATLSAPTAGS